MSKALWDLEQPRGRLLPALVAGLVPVLVGLLVTGFVLVRPALRGLDQAQSVLSAATKLRETSQTLQRDVLLLVFDEETRAATGLRLDSQIPLLRQQADTLAATLEPLDAERAGQIRQSHHELGDGVAAVAESVRAAAGVNAVWSAVQEKVIAEEVAATRNLEPVIKGYQAFLTDAVGEVRTAIWLSAATMLVALVFAVASSAVVLRR